MKLWWSMLMSVFFNGKMCGVLGGVMDQGKTCSGWWDPIRKHTANCPLWHFISPGVLECLKQTFGDAADAVSVEILHGCILKLIITSVGVDCNCLGRWPLPQGAVWCDPWCCLGGLVTSQLILPRSCNCSSEMTGCSLTHAHTHTHACTKPF